MKKYLLRYLVFWLPAFLIVMLKDMVPTVSQSLQWFFAFFMIFGWSANTGAAAYHYPKKTLSLLFFYAGVNLLIIAALYKSTYNGVLHGFLMNVGGAFSFTPLTVFIMAILQMSIPHEIYVTAFLIVCCLIGYLAGLAARRFYPDPYRPKMMK